jgi:ABC-type oligopeptide transport system substrate-binding subunit
VRTLHTDAQYVGEAFCLCDPVYDAMVEDWEATSDEEEIARKAIEIQRFLMSNYSPVFFWYLGFQRTLYKSTFRNINPFENVSGHYSWIDESYLEG